MKILINASALAKGLLREPGWEQAHGFAMGADILYASRLAYPETRSALARARRQGRLRDAEVRRLVAELDRRWDQVQVIELTDGVARLAGDVAERHALRAGDAVHLASALILRDPEITVATWDRGLARAAHDAGLPVAPALG